MSSFLLGFAVVACSTQTCVSLSPPLPFPTPSSRPSPHLFALHPPFFHLPQATATSFHAGLLLQPLSVAFERLPSLRKPNIRLYRDFWLYSFILGLSTSHAIFPPEWSSHLKSIAAKSPNLLSDGADHYFQLDLELSFVADIGSSQPKILQEVQHTLQELTNHALATEQATTQFTFVQCIFLTSLYHLEQMRLKAMPSSFPSIFLYLEDKGLQKDPAVWSVLRSIVSKLLTEYIGFIKTESLDKKRSSLLEHFACVLVEKLAHIHEGVRQVASTSLTALTEAFPHLLTSPKVITCLLDQLERCFESITLLEMKGEHGGRSLRMTHSIIQLEGSQTRQEALGQLAEETKGFLRRAKQWSPQQAKGAMQVCICSKQGMFKVQTKHFIITITITVLLLLLLGI